MNIDHKVAQLLVSRVCHDLAGGVSAVTTGAELLGEDDQAMDEEVLKVIAMSAHQSASRLAFFRVTFGLGGGENDTITTNEAKVLLHDFIEGGRLSLVWGADNIRIGLMQAKLLLNLCLIGTESLPRGGVVRVDVSKVADRLGFAVSVRGDGAGLRPGVDNAFSVDADLELLNARTVHAHFAAVLAQTLGAEMEIQSEEEGEIRLAALM